MKSGRLPKAPQTGKGGRTMDKNRAALYCRLSKDDEQLGESVSIETQKILLTTFCISQNFEIADVYIDDGYSGLNFNRPSFQKMIRDLENGNFDIVVTKDLSRLGRDYIQTGYYIDVYFFKKHIRYIAVNDGVDTLSGNTDIAPFKNILNDMYARDLSRKVKSAKHHRAKNGLYISAQPPYGYRVDPCNKNRLLIDPVAAETVKYIFDLAGEGKNYSEISRLLEKQQIISPSAYKVMNGDTRFIKFTSQNPICQWSYQTVKSILCNPVYVGDMVNHKVETVNYKTKERVRVPAEEQIIVRNTHEALIDRAAFEAVNAALGKRRSSNHSYENMFKGLLYCAECGEEMQLIAKKAKDKTLPMFRCAKHIADPGACTHYHYIYYHDLIDEVRKELKRQIKRLLKANKDALYEKTTENIRDLAEKIRKDRLQKELQTVNKRIKDTYKSLPVKTAAAELEPLYQMQKVLLRKITKTSVPSVIVENTNTDRIAVLIKNFVAGIPIDRKTLQLTIEKIEIGHLEKITPGKTVQAITIHYRF